MHSLFLLGSLSVRQGLELIEKSDVGFVEAALALVGVVELLIDVVLT